MIKELTDPTQLDGEIEKGVNIVEFYSKTCGPCKMLAYVLKDVDKTYGDRVNTVQVDFEANPDLTKKYSIEGYPTLLVFRDGAEVTRRSGLQRKNVIEGLIEEAMA